MAQELGSGGKITIIFHMYITHHYSLSYTCIRRWQTARFCHLHICGGIISHLLLFAVSFGVPVLLEEGKNEKADSSSCE